MDKEIIRILRWEMAYLRFWFILLTVDDDGTIVAVGTGNACLSSDSLSQDGRVLIDSYALATARRALLK